MNFVTKGQRISEIKDKQIFSWRTLGRISPASIGVCLFLVSFSIPHSQNIPIFLLAVVGIIVSFTKIRSGSRERKLITVLVMIFISVTLLSIIFSKDINRSLFTSFPLEPAILVFFITAYYYRSNNDLIATYASLFIISMGSIFLLFLTAISNPDKQTLMWVKLSQIPIIIVPNDISFACIVAPLILGVCYYLNIAALFYFVFPCILFIAITASIYQSAVSLLCLGVSLSCFFLLGRKFYIFWLLLLSLLLVLGIDIFLGQPLVGKVILTIKHKGWDPRVALWIVAFGMFLASPLLGYGPHTFVHYYNKEFIDQLNLPSYLPLDPRSVPWAHNLYLEMLAERGFIGFLSLVSIMSVSIYFGYRLIKLCPSRERFLVIGVFSAMIGFCAGSIVEFTFLRFWVVVIFFTLVGCSITHGNIIKSEQKELCNGKN